jgi:hypothetical protein
LERQIKPTLVFIILTIGMLTLSPVSAEEDTRWFLGFKAGYFSPQEDGWDDIYGDGNVEFVGQGGLKISPKWDIGIEGGYFTEKGSSRTPSGGISTLRQKIQLFPLKVFFIFNAIFEKSQLLVPFAGGGYSHVIFLQSLDGQSTISGDRSGFHGRGGLKILLDIIDPVGADAFNIGWGVKNTYFIMEAQYSRADDFGSDSINLGGWSYLGGIVVEF